MKFFARIVVALALAVTAGAVATWWATGRHIFTKFEVVARVDVPNAPGDVLTEAGLYEGPTHTETVVRRGFHLGLLPAPQRWLDRHALSVVSVVVPAWTAALLALWFAAGARDAPDSDAGDDP